MDFDEDVFTIFEQNEFEECEEDWHSYGDLFTAYDEVIKRKSSKLGAIDVRESEDIRKLSEPTIITPPSSDAGSSADESSSEDTITPICLRKLSISDSQLKFLNLYSFYPIPEDPGLDPAFWILFPNPPVYKSDGIQQFYDYAKLLDICPIGNLKTQLISDEVNLKYYGADPEIIIALSEALYHNPTVTKLNLQENILTKEACFRLNNLLIQNHILSDLDLTACKIGVDGAMMLQEGIINSSALNTLILCRCELGNEGFSYIAKAVIGTTLLQNLDISNNNLDEGSADDMCEMVASTESLEYLNISWNNFQPKEVSEKLFTGLTKNGTLKTIDITWNSLGNESSGFASKYIQNSRTIQHIYLGANRYTNLEAAQIGNGVRGNRSLHSFEFNKNPVGASGITQFIQSLLNEAFCQYAPLTLLNFEHCYASKEVIPILDQLKIMKPKLEIKLAGILENFVIVGPDTRELFFKSANHEAMLPKRKQERRDFGLIVLQLEDGKLEKEKFIERVLMSGCKISETLLIEIANLFSLSRKYMDVTALKESYISYFPDTKLPSDEGKEEDTASKKSKKSKTGKKKKGKAKGKKDAKKGKKKKK